MKSDIVIFDIGNVLLPYDWTKVLPHLPYADKKQLYEWLHGPDYTLFEMGKITATDLVRSFNAFFKTSYSQKELLSLFNIIFDPVPAYVYENIPLLSERFYLYALSNTCSWHEQYFMKEMKEVWLHFEDIFCSHHLGVRKPSGEIYRLVIRSVRGKSGRIYFLDDKIENVQAAQQEGWVAYHVPHLKKVEETMKTLLMLR